MTQDTVVVTQSAKDAAKAFWNQHIAGWQEQGQGQRALIQALAAAEQRGFKLCQDAAVKVAEAAFPANDGTSYTNGQRQACRNLADAIRALSIKETDNAR